MDHDVLCEKLPTTAVARNANKKKINIRAVILKKSFLESEVGFGTSKVNSKKCKMRSRIALKDHPEHLELRRPWFGASGGAAGHFGWDPAQLRRPKNEYGHRGSAIFRVRGRRHLGKGLGLELAAGARMKKTLGPFLRHSDLDKPDNTPLTPSFLGGWRIT